jgi:hypothetical protein
LALSTVFVREFAQAPEGTNDLFCRATGREIGLYFRRLRSVKAIAEQIVDLDSIEVFGRVVGVRGLMVEIRMIWSENRGPLFATMRLEREN